MVDTTGAGDAYAAGFLYGFSHDQSIMNCGRIASVMAGTVIEQIGPRIETASMKTLKERLSNIP